MSMTVLVVGGTGPTGPFIVNGLLERGYRATILHRGTHEIPEIPAAVEHIHADPHFRETLDSALAGRNFDLVIATYGRLRIVAEALKGKTPRFIGVGGVASYRGFYRPAAVFPTGLQTPTPEDAPTVASEEEQRFAYLIASTEQAVLQCHPNGAVFRYPYVYGPYQLVPREWSVIRRILDKRPYIIVADGGLTLMTHGYAANLAHAILLAVDRPEASAGQIYNCGDERQLTVRQLIELISSKMSYECEIIGVPDGIGPGARPLTFHDTSHHRVMDLFKIKTDLGYKDLFSTEEALARTIRWYLEHPLERGGDIEKMLPDPFDYAAEDQLVTIFRESLQRMRAVSFATLEPTPHAYAHPKVPGTRDHRNR